MGAVFLINWRTQVNIMAINPTTSESEQHAAAPLAIDALLPRVDTEIFRFQPEAHFWIGKTAARGGSIVAPDVYQAAGILRARVYIDEYSFLPGDARNIDGTESDAEDIRSSHFAVVENSEGGNRLVGTTRLIKKETDDQTLQVEKLFPEAFADTPAPVGSVEASRFIARHPNKLLQHMVSLSLIRSMVLEANEEGSPYIYAVVEEHLERLFRNIGLPLVRLAEAKLIEEYNTPNMPLRFSPMDILETAKADTNNRLKMTPFFRGQGPTHGLGFYDESLTISPSQEAN